LTCEYTSHIIVHGGKYFTKGGVIVGFEDNKGEK
jgi:hypothetical protein